MKNLSKLSKSLVPVLLIAGAQSHAKDSKAARIGASGVTVPPQIMERLVETHILTAVAPNEYRVDVSSVEAETAMSMDFELSEFAVMLAKSAGEKSTVTVKSSNNIIVGTQDGGGIGTGIGVR